MTPKKERLDQALTRLEMVKTRSEARAAIMAGLVTVDGEKIDKAGFQVKADSSIKLTASPRKYVSRGGGKIAGAYKDFTFDCENRNAIDGGASTGGFTDFLLKHGAAHVYAIDVGYGQLDWSLRTNSKVTVMERTNLRYVKKEDLKNGTPDLAVMDLSFISILKVIPALTQLLAPDSEIVTLVKPQFEAGPGRVGKGGIVRDEHIHRDVFLEVTGALLETEFRPVDCTFSPLKGPKGNIEFFLHLARGEKLKSKPAITAAFVEDIVRKAHQTLKNE